jgi:hypothetical protein
MNQGLLIDTHPAKVEGIEVVCREKRSSTTASMTCYTDDCEGLKLAPKTNKSSFRRKNTTSSVSKKGYPGSTRQRTHMLLVHRIPVNTLPEHVSNMFLQHAAIRPKSVKEIFFTGVLGKCYVEFMTSRHAELAYDMLIGKERLDCYGNVQKFVELIGGGTIGVRQMMK